MQVPKVAVEVETTGVLAAVRGALENENRGDQRIKGRGIESGENLNSRDGSSSSIDGRDGSSDGESEVPTGEKDRARQSRREGVSG